MDYASHHDEGVITPAPPGKLTTVAPAIICEDAAVSLGGRRIWSSANFSIKTGECVAVLGQNGSGKTTMLRVILGQVLLSSGRITVLGGPPRQGNRAISLIPQRRELVSDLTIRARDLVLLGLNGYRWGFGWPSPKEQRHVLRALEVVGALDYADEPVGILSGGLQQRVFIAQVLLDDLQLLLLDEPLTSLDLRSQQEIVTLLSKINRSGGVTTLIVTHDLNPVLPIIDRVLYILDGCPYCGSVPEVVDATTLSRLYGMPIRVLQTPEGEMFIRGAA